MTISDTVLKALARRIPTDTLVAPPHRVPGEKHPIAVDYGIDDISSAYIVFEEGESSTRIDYVRGGMPSGAGIAQWSFDADLSETVDGDADPRMDPFIDRVAADVMATYEGLIRHLPEPISVPMDLTRVSALANVVLQSVKDIPVTEAAWRQIGVLVDILRASDFELPVVRRAVAEFDKDRPDIDRPHA